EDGIVVGGREVVLVVLRYEGSEHPAHLNHRVDDAHTVVSAEAFYSAWGKCRGSESTRGSAEEGTAGLFDDSSSCSINLASGVISAMAMRMDPHVSFLVLRSSFSDAPYDRNYRTQQPQCRSSLTVQGGNMFEHKSSVQHHVESSFLRYWLALLLSVMLIDLVTGCIAAEVPVHYDDCRRSEISSVLVNSIAL
ncbi:hypothetical protein BO71DRAFT_413958, partial [Aspergillus ellipticus CBS 707.79]